MTLPILAMVMAPESVSTTLQSGSSTMASMTSKASPSERPLKAVLRHAAEEVGEGGDLVEVEALEGDEAVVSGRRGTRDGRSSEDSTTKAAKAQRNDLERGSPSSLTGIHTGININI